MAKRPTDDEGREAWAGFALSIAGTTHVGRVRKSNQDAFDRFDDDARDETLLVVADGMGGHRGGEVASRMAVGTLGKLVRELDGEPDERLRLALERANHEIHRLGERDSMLRGMGTTAVALLLRPEGKALLAHVGDSRIYRLREDSFEALTEDHSMVARWLKDGLIDEETARNHPQRNQIDRALGAAETVAPDLLECELRAGDLFLLCSDGLTGMLPDEELQRLATRSRDPHAIVAWMIDAANQAGGMDNVTAVIARLDEG
jgi:serine/threonine protein phosphatase PrpC